MLKAFSWQFSRKLHLMCFRLKILIAKFVTLVDKNVIIFCIAYFEIK